MGYKPTVGVALVLFGLIAAGCGSSDEGTESTTRPKATTGDVVAGKSVTIEMQDNFFVPNAATTKAGTVTIAASNQGALVHELVLARTDANPAKLPTTSDGEVDEAKLEASGQLAGEIADVAPGASKPGEFKLSPGKYVMFCNIPGHYAAGMYGTITVK